MFPVKHLILVAVFFFFIIHYSSLAGSELNDLQRQFDFAESLFAEGDYFRAITEYKRFIFYYPHDKIRTEKSTFRIGESYFNAGRWIEAAKEFSSFSENNPHSAMCFDAQYFRGLSEMHLKQYEDALSTFNDIIKDKTSVNYNKAIYQVALIRIERREWQTAKKTFLMIPKDSSLFSAANIMSSGLDRIEEVPQKSPLLAGTIAAIIPGAGHLYTDRPKDGAVSFLLNASFILAAIELFKHDNYVAGAIVTFFELGWYSGNIYSAINSAHKFNRNNQDEFIQKLKERSIISYYFNPDTHTNLLMLSMRF